MKAAVNIQTFDSLIKLRLIMIGKGRFEVKSDSLEEKTYFTLPDNSCVELNYKDQTGFMFLSEMGQITSDHDLNSPDHFNSLLYSVDLHLFDGRRKNSGAPPVEISMLANQVLITEDPVVQKALQELNDSFLSVFDPEGLENWQPGLVARGFIHLCSSSEDPEVEQAAKRLLLVLKWGENLSRFNSKTLEQQTLDYTQILVQEDWSPRNRF